MMDCEGKPAEEPMPRVFLPHRGVVKVVGDDARGFLQGLVTADMKAVAPDHPAYGALLTPQGKIIVDFLLAEAPAADGGGFFLDCPRALAPDLMQRLNRYRLRARVIIEDISEVAGIVAAFAGDRFDPDDGLVFADPRAAALGERAFVARSRAAALAPDPLAAYERHRIGLGVPEGGADFVYGDTFPHEANMDRLGGVSFTKGCYVGQEVVSRMQHRGSGGRTRILRVRLADRLAVEPGTEIMAGDRPLGFIGSQAGGEGLAKLRLDRLADARAAGQALTAGGVGLEPVEGDLAGA
jgi:hypothetical protein